jgi:hypothetical protein
MTVNITISGTSGSDSLADSVDLGTDIDPGNDTNIQDLFVRHDATVNPITDCAWYSYRYTASGYLGDDPDDDFTEIMGWGDAATGGFTINQTIPVGWTTGTQFNVLNDQVFKNGYGDINNQLILDQNSINIGTPAGDGVIPLSGEAHVQVRCQIPAAVTSAGYRGIQLVFVYSATS